MTSRLMKATGFSVLISLFSVFMTGAAAKSDESENGGTIILGVSHILTFKGTTGTISFVVVPEIVMQELEKAFESEAAVRVRFGASETDATLYQHDNGAVFGRAGDGRESFVVVTRSWIRGSRDWQ